MTQSSPQFFKRRGRFIIQRVLQHAFHFANALFFISSDLLPDGTAELGKVSLDIILVDVSKIDCKAIQRTRTFLAD